MVTIKEIAKECNVSIATISNVLNKKGRVSLETEKKVLAKIEELGYVRNLFAKNLKASGSRIIGIITEDITVFNTVEIVDGINEFLEGEDYDIVLGNLRLFKKYGNEFYKRDEYIPRVHEEFRLMKGKQVGGIIYIGAHSRRISYLQEDYDIPVVMAYCEGTQDSFMFDDRTAAYDAICELVKRGHKKIGVITGDIDSNHTQLRLDGIKRAAEKYRLNIGIDIIVVNGDWSRKSGYLQVNNLLSKDTDITAVFAMNDIMAAGIYDYASENNIKIGKDLAVIGFDDREFATAFKPELATMALPLKSIGTAAARAVIDRINEIRKHEEGDAVEVVDLDAKFEENLSIKNIEIEVDDTSKKDKDISDALCRNYIIEDGVTKFRCEFIERESICK